MRAGNETVPVGFSGQQLTINTVCGLIPGPGENIHHYAVTCNQGAGTMAVNLVTVQKLGTKGLAMKEVVINIGEK